MDTVFLSVPALLARLGTRHWPLVVDVRRPLAFDADSSMVAGALRCAPDAIAEFAARVSPGSRSSAIARTAATSVEAPPCA